MMCPYCGGDSKVVETRCDGRQIRRRKCKDCRRLFYTLETACEDYEAADRLFRQVYNNLHGWRSRKEK